MTSSPTSLIKKRTRRSSPLSAPASRHTTLAELDRVCRSGGTIIVPTYMNRSEQGKTSGFASTVGKAGADFKRQFTFDTYKQFIAAAGYDDVDYAYCPGRVPCAVAVIHKP